MKKNLNLLLTVFTLALALCTSAAPRTGLSLQDGDTFVFLGDSITHQCLYSQYFEDYFYTRFPDRHIHFHNAGVGGDRAADALARLAEDVTAFKPKYVSILLGMNDGSYTNFDAEIFATYERDMLKLLEEIKACGAQPILMSPTMFDHAVHEMKVAEAKSKARPRSPYYNAVLSFYGTWAREQALRQHLSYVNMWGPLNDLTMEKRKTDPQFTMIPDAVHPGPGGQFIMADSMINDLKSERPNVSAITISRPGGNWRATALGGKVENLQGTEDGISFTFNAVCLPWVIPEKAGSADSKRKYPTEDARLGFDLAKAGHRHSNERLLVAGLPVGSYEVRIDGKSIGKPVTHVTLGAHLELQANPETPQYQQALQVALLNQERNDKAVRPLRDLWGKVKGARKSKDPAQFEQFMKSTRPEIEKLVGLGREYEEKIYAAAKPVPRRYEIERVATPAPSAVKGKAKAKAAKAKQG